MSLLKQQYLAPWAYVTTYLNAATVGTIFVFLEDLQSRYGLSDLQIGAVASVSFVSALFTQLALSPLADRGHVRPLAYLSVLASVVGVVGFALSQTFVLLLVTRGLLGVGMGLFSIAARKAILGLSVDGGGAKIGTLYSCGVGGFISGPALGAVLGAISFEAPFILIGVLVAFFGTGAAWVIGQAEIAVSPVQYRDVPDLLRSPRVQSALLIQAIVFGFIGVFDATLDKFLTDMGATTLTTALVLLTIGAPLLVLPRFAGNVAETRGAVTLALPSTAIVVANIALYGIAPSIVMVALVGLVHGISESFANMSGQMMMLEETGTERAAIGNGVMEVVGLSLAAVAAVIGPVVYGAYGDGVLFGGTAVFGLVLALVLTNRIAAVRRHDATPLFDDGQQRRIHGGGDPAMEGATGSGQRTSSPCVR